MTSKLIKILIGVSLVSASTTVGSFAAAGLDQTTPVETLAGNGAECPFVDFVIPPGWCLSANLGAPYYPPTGPANTGLGGAGAGIPRAVSAIL